MFLAPKGVPIGGPQIVTGFWRQKDCDEAILGDFFMTFLLHGHEDMIRVRASVLIA